MPDTYLPAAARTIFGGPLEHAGTLGPCPFCGGDAEIGVEVQGGYFVQCTNAACGVSSALIFPLMDDVKPLLIERWNRRAAGDERRHMLLPEPAYKHIDGDTDDAVLLWAEIHHLRAALQGPDGYATWQDAATDERIRRIKAERLLTTPDRAANSLAAPAWDDSVNQAERFGTSPEAVDVASAPAAALGRGPEEYEAVDRIHTLVGQLAEKEIECSRLREAVQVISVAEFAIAQLKARRDLAAGIRARLKARAVEEKNRALERARALADHYHKATPAGAPPSGGCGMEVAEQLEVLALLNVAHDALDGMADSDLDYFETEEEELEAVPAQFAARKVMQAIQIMAKRDAA